MTDADDARQTRAIKSMEWMLTAEMPRALLLFSLKKKKKFNFPLLLFFCFNVEGSEEEKMKTKLKI